MTRPMRASMSMWATCLLATWRQVLFRLASGRRAADAVLAAKLQHLLGVGGMHPPHLVVDVLGWTCTGRRAQGGRGRVDVTRWTCSGRRGQVDVLRWTCSGRRGQVDVLLLLLPAAAAAHKNIYGCCCC